MRGVEERRIEQTRQNKEGRREAKVKDKDLTKTLIQFLPIFQRSFSHQSVNCQFLVPDLPSEPFGFHRLLTDSIKELEQRSPPVGICYLLLQYMFSCKKLAYGKSLHPQDCA